MYAVVKTGGKQYRVAKDDVLTVEKLDAEAGAVIELAEVLAIDDGKGLTIGTPMIDGARVAATVLEQKKADKVIIDNNAQGGQGVVPYLPLNELQKSTKGATQ